MTDPDDKHILRKEKTTLFIFIHTESLKDLIQINRRYLDPNGDPAMDLQT